MAAFTSIALGVGAAASVAGTIISANQQRKAAKLQQAQQASATRRSRRKAIREAQITRAQTVAGGQASGAIGSSALAGGLGSLSSQLGEALGYSTHMSGLSRDIAAAQSRAANWSSIASLGGSLYSFASNGGFDGMFQKPVSPAGATGGASMGGLGSSLRPQMRPNAPWSSRYGYGM